ncbi:MAG: nickel pincer cofactor biosynthesis protein LarB [Candidatus Riflebacteria bacterium]|jgi:NCAIR mutase (PurE)-related protein|nr:nickel pincer cofactor biosynthesis protein LarB [Candidatus Riflebacteria bacterium]
METVDLNTVRILEDYKNGLIGAGEAARCLMDRSRNSSESSGEPLQGEEALTSDAVLDTGREARAGFPEAIFGAGKNPEQICEIFIKLFETTGKALATRCSEKALQLLEKKCPQVNINYSCGLAWAVSDIVLCPWGRVAILAAGTSDIPVAEEAALTLEFMGFAVERIFDVGVAGLHRLLNRVEQFRSADAIIVVAGMEGALPSVVGGLTPCPVIAVPTSVGYGASFNGLAALLGMLNSCSAGVTVVNIDNGFGAAAAAVRILKGKSR